MWSAGNDPSAQRVAGFALDPEPFGTVWMTTGFDPEPLDPEFALTIGFAAEPDPEPVADPEPAADPETNADPGSAEPAFADPAGATSADPEALALPELCAGSSRSLPPRTTSTTA